MSERVDRNRASESVDRAIRIRAREIQKKQINQEFETKLATTEQKGAKASTQEVAREVLEKFAQGEEKAKTPTLASNQTRESLVPKKTIQQEKSQKADQKKTQKDTHENKDVEKKNEKTALDIAVQRKNQQDEDSGEFGGSSGGNFFQQAVSLGMAVQKSEVAAPAPVQIPEEVLNQIVDQIYTGVNAEGASVFVIDLKTGVLNGGRIQISAQGKSIKLKFSGLDTRSKQQIRSSQGELGQRLGSKGLKIVDFEVG